MDATNESSNEPASEESIFLYKNTGTANVNWYDFAELAVDVFDDVADLIYIEDAYELARSYEQFLMLAEKVSASIAKMGGKMSNIALQFDSNVAGNMHPRGSYGHFIASIIYRVNMLDAVRAEQLLDACLEAKIVHPDFKLV